MRSNLETPKPPKEESCTGHADLLSRKEEEERDKEKLNT